MTRQHVVLHEGLGSHLKSVRSLLGQWRCVDADVGALTPGHERLRDAGVFVIGVEGGGLDAFIALPRVVRAAAQHVAVYAVGVRAQRLSRRFSNLATAGADQAFELDVAGDADALVDLVAAKVASTISDQAMEPLLVRAASVPGLVTLVGWCLRNGDRHQRVQDVADLFGADRKTQYRLCRRVLGMSLGDLLAHGRYLRAEALHARGLSYQQIADRMEYDTPSAVWKVLKHG